LWGQGAALCHAQADACITAPHCTCHLTHWRCPTPTHPHPHTHTRLLQVCFAFFLMLGTVGWRASLLFVRRIYQVSLTECAWVVFECVCVYI
jgi:hypothetical protein